MNSRRRQVFVISLVLWLAVNGHDSSCVEARIIVPDRLLKDGVKVLLNV